MSQQLLEAFNSAPYAWEKVEKNGMMDIVYSFTDEQDHSYRYHFEKRVNYGRNVFVVTLGQKAPSLKMYKRVFGKFANPLRVIATLIEVVKDVKATRKDVKGVIIEVPEQAFGSHGRLVDRILKRELRSELTVEDMDFQADEFETLGLKGTVATLKPNRFKQVFTGKLMQEILAKREADGKGYSSTTDSDAPVIANPVAEPAKQGFQPKGTTDEKTVKIKAGKSDFSQRLTFETESSNHSEVKGIVSNNLSNFGLITGIGGVIRLPIEDELASTIEKRIAIASAVQSLKNAGYEVSYDSTIRDDIFKADMAKAKQSDAAREAKKNITYIVKDDGNVAACFSFEEELMTAYEAVLATGFEDVATIANGQGEDKYRLIVTTDKLSAQEFADLLEPLIGKAFEVRDKKPQTTSYNYKLLVDERYDIRMIFDTPENAKLAYETLTGAVALSYGNSTLHLYGNAISSLKSNVTGRQMDAKVARLTELLGEPNTSETNLGSNTGAELENARIDISVEEGEEPATTEIVFQHNSTTEYASIQQDIESVVKKSFRDAKRVSGSQLDDMMSMIVGSGYLAINDELLDIKKALELKGSEVILHLPEVPDDIKAIGNALKEMNKQPVQVDIHEGDDWGLTTVIIEHPYGLQGTQNDVLKIAQNHLAVLPKTIRKSGTDVYFTVSGEIGDMGEQITAMKNALDAYANVTSFKVNGSEWVGTKADTVIEYQTADGFKFEVDGRKLSFKADINFNAIMDYVFGWFKTEFDSIDDKRQFVDKTNGENLTQNFIGVLSKLSIKEAISKKLAEQFDSIISQTHTNLDLGTTMYERSIGAPAGVISDYREFKAILNDTCTCVTFYSNTGPFIKSVVESFGNTGYELNGNENSIKVPLNANFEFKSFDERIIGKFLKAHDDAYGATTGRTNPVKKTPNGIITFQPSRKYASISLIQDVACYLTGLEQYEQKSNIPSIVGFDNINNLEEFYTLCDVLENYDFEGNFLKAFKCSKYINDAKANGGRLEIKKGGKSLVVEIQSDLIFINISGMTLPKANTVLWKEGETSVFLRTFHMGHKKFNDSLVVLDNFLDKELSNTTQSEIPTAVVDSVHGFHFEHQKGGFKIVTDGSFQAVSGLVGGDVDLSDNGDGSHFVKLSHFSKTVGTKKLVAQALTKAGWTEGDHVATPGSAAANAKASVTSIQTTSNKASANEKGYLYDMEASSTLIRLKAAPAMLRKMFRSIDNFEMKYSLFPDRGGIFLLNPQEGISIGKPNVDEVIEIKKEILLYLGEPNSISVDGSASKPTSINWATADTALKGQYFKDSNYKVVTMKVDELISRQSNDYRIDAGSDTNRIKGRAERALAHITSGAPMDMPVVDIDANGNLQVVDGRHRIAVAKEMGLKEIPVFLSQASSAKPTGKAKYQYSMSILERAISISASEKSLKAIQARFEDKLLPAFAIERISRNSGSELIVVFDRYTKPDVLQMAYDFIVNDIGAPTTETGVPEVDALRNGDNKFDIAEHVQAMRKRGKPFILAPNAKALTKKGLPLQGVLLMDNDGNGRFFKAFGESITVAQAMNWKDKFDVKHEARSVFSKLKGGAGYNGTVYMYDLSFDATGVKIQNDVEEKNTQGVEIERRISELTDIAVRKWNVEYTIDQTKNLSNEVFRSKYDADKLKMTSEYDSIISQLTDMMSGASDADKAKIQRSLDMIKDHYKTRGGKETDFQSQWNSLINAKVEYAKEVAAQSAPQPVAKPVAQAAPQPAATQSSVVPNKNVTGMVELFVKFTLRDKDEYLYIRDGKVTHKAQYGTETENNLYIFGPSFQGETLAYAEQFVKTELLKMYYNGATAKEFEDTVTGWLKGGAEKRSGGYYKDRGWVHRVKDERQYADAPSSKEPSKLAPALLSAITSVAKNGTPKKVTGFDLRVSATRAYDGRNGRMNDVLMISGEQAQQVEKSLRAAGGSRILLGPSRTGELVIEFENTIKKRKSKLTFACNGLVDGSYNSLKWEYSEVTKNEIDIEISKTFTDSANSIANEFSALIGAPDMRYTVIKDTRKPAIVVSKDVEGFKTLLSGLDIMVESIKEDLTGVAQNKVELALLESAMRKMGIYQSAFGYGGGSFTVTMTEGVVDILPSQGNIDYLQKMLGIKLGHELVKDARGGLRFEIS